MNRQTEQGAHREVDSIQQRLTEYAGSLDYAKLSPEAIHGAKVRIIDTLGVLMGGFFNEPCYRARNLAARVLQPDGATIIGTRIKTSPDMAAFVNGTTARYIEMSDTYHRHGSAGGHASDMITPVLAVAEQARASGRDFITAIVLAYEVYLRISDVFPNLDFDHTTFCCLGTAVAAGKLLRLTPQQLSHCISMAIVPNNSLRQARTGHQTMWRAGATGQAGRAGVFAALLAQADMEGPHLPFEGKAGWCDHVARKRFTLDAMGGDGTPFKILETRIKFHSSSGNTIASVLAAEKIAPLKNVKDVAKITVEVNQKTLGISGIGEQNSNPDSRESADHSVQYLVAATLRDGTVTPHSFNDSHLWNPELRALMQKIEVVENKDFTLASERLPVENCARVTVVTASGERLIGDVSSAKSKTGKATEDAQIAEKFRALSEDWLGAKRTNAILERLGKLEEMKDVATLPPDFILD